MFRSYLLHVFVLLQKSPWLLTVKTIYWLQPIQSTTKSVI